MSKDPKDLLVDLVQIPSHQSPDRIRDYLVNQIPEAEIHEESGCVVAEKGPDDGDPHIFLNSHMDVVPPDLEVRIEDGIVYGRGACDAKASLAMMICAFESVTPKEAKLTLVISPDEETYSEGLYDYLALEGESGDFAINGEPTGLDVCDAARGSLKYVVEVTGEAAHAGTSASGQSAVSCAAEMIRRVEQMDQLTHEYLGTTDQTISWIEGGPVGELTSQVPRKVRLFINRWSVPPETPSAYQEQLASTMDDLDCEVSIRYPYRPNRFLEAYEVDEDTPVIQDLAATVESVTGLEPDIRPFSVAAESSFFQRYMPVAVFGPGLIADEDGPIGHSDREYLEVDELRKAVSVMEQYLDDVA
jgi:acetylornithine deacetylase